MPIEPTLVKSVRRHAHDVRNHCSGIDLDATLLSELSDDPEITAMAFRLKKQVARIELELKLLVLRTEEPRPVTLTVDDLVQLWRMKLISGSNDGGSVIWPEKAGEGAITVDTKRTVQVLTAMTMRIWDHHPGAALDVNVRMVREHVLLSLVQPRSTLPPAAEFLEEIGTLLNAGGLLLTSELDADAQRWVITLAIPLNPSP